MINVFSEVKRQNEALKNRLNAITNGDKEEVIKMDARISDIDEYLLSINPPDNFSMFSSDGFFKRTDIAFEKLMFSIEQKGVSNPKKRTVFEINSIIDSINTKK